MISLLFDISNQYGAEHKIKIVWILTDMQEQR
jgi:hypothetical protein